jgi:hypothetical protein
VHQVLVGRTGTGKTALAKQLGAALIREGVEVIAYNPIGDHAYTRPIDGRVYASSEYRDPHRFLEEIAKRIERGDGRPLFLIIDEAPTFFRKVNCPRAWLATLGRHHGINLIILAQHYADLNTTVRGQCERIYVFACSLTTAAMCADEFGEPELKSAPRQKRLHYMRVDHDGLTRGRLTG